MPFYRWSQRSENILSTCHVDLQDVANAAANFMDITIIEGHRHPLQQQELVRQGVSKAGPGESLHNYYPSLAIDMAPYPVDWENRERWLMFGGFIKGIAFSQGIHLRWGGDWNGNWSTKDQKFHDMPHFELIHPTWRGINPPPERNIPKWDWAEFLKRDV